MDDQTANPKPQSPTPGLGRVLIPDERDRNYPMQAVLRAAVTLPRFKYHSTFWPPLDQGLTSQCVVYSTAGDLIASPTRYKRDLFTPAYLAERYAYAQNNDEWPGAEPEYYGTSVRAGFEAWRERGFVSNYWHAQSMDDLELWILTQHPVVFGANWYSSFDAPDPKTGLVKLTPGAYIRGGHAWLCYGYNRESGVFACQNSWGLWGVNGRFKIGYDDVKRLIFDEWGDAIGATEVAP